MGKTQHMTKLICYLLSIICYLLSVKILTLQKFCVLCSRISQMVSMCLTRSPHRKTRQYHTQPSASSLVRACCVIGTDD